MQWFTKMAEEKPNQLVLILAAAFGVMGFLTSRNLFKDGDDLIGSTAPVIAMNTVDDAPISIERYRGKPIIINFWATWCPPCVQEMPMLDALHKSGDAVVIGVATDEAADVKAFIERYKLKMPIVLDYDAPGLARALAVPRTIPYTVAIDRQGKVVATQRTMLSESDLKDMVRKAGG
jgi:thiol-disulfide isomerase/thioredoxin